MWLELGQRSSDAWGTASALNLLGAIARADGDATGPARFAAALALFRELGEGSRVALVQCHAGALALGRGDFVDAQARLEEVLALYRNLDDPYWMATVLSNLALVAGERGEYRRAAGLHVEGLALWRTGGARKGWATG